MENKTLPQYWDLSALESEMFECNCEWCKPFNTCSKCEDTFTKITAMKEINELRKIEEKYRELLEEVSYKRLNK